MKVTCQYCNNSFKVKGEVAPGKAFKFKCLKCGQVNRIVSRESGFEPKPIPKAKCADCGTEVKAPESGEALCEQCRASRAVEEARKKSRELMEDSELDFPDEIFEGGDEELPELADEAESAAAEPLPSDMEPTEIEIPEDEEEEEEEEEKGTEEEAGEEKPPEEQKPAAKEKEESRYQVRSRDGLVIGPIKLPTLRDLILADKVHSNEECRKDDGEWMGMLELPEIFEIFENEKVEAKKETGREEEPDREKLLESLKVKKQCAGCGAEILVLEETPHPLCDQCRIEVLVAKKREAVAEGEPRYKIRNADGLVLGPLRKSTVEDLVTAGNVRGNEEVSVDGGEWRPITDVEELAELFEDEDIDVIDLTETVDG